MLSVRLYYTLLVEGLACERSVPYYFSFVLWFGTSKSYFYALNKKYSMQKALSATLYEDNNPNAARSIRVEIKDGLVTFEQQDIGSLCNEMFGDSDYERVIFDLPVEQLRSAMDVNTDKELISVLKRDYSTSDAFDRFSEFVYDNHLKYNIYCG